MKLYIDIDNSSHLAEAAAYLLRKYGKGIEFQAQSNSDAVLCFMEDTFLSGDDYRVYIEGKDITIYGNTAVAFNAAVGKAMRVGFDKLCSQTCHFDREIRAVYFANHFYNYYHSAPIEEVCEYLESLALWGQSIIWLWFDMHHFTGLSDPNAAKMLERMIRIFEKAKSLGMKTALTKLANEYYKNAPLELLAENSTENGLYHSKLCGFYNTELCPSKNEGRHLVLSAMDELLAKFSDVGLDYISMWPYDQGGCTCDECYPWGANGFYSLAKESAELARQHFPKIKIVFSAWHFDSFTLGEWNAFFDRLERDKTWMDYLLVDIGAYLPKKLYSCGVPVISFPEISMYTAVPWGGYGANPFPKELKAQFDKTAELCKGGICYSEGIFEDINKVICLEIFRDRDCDVEEVIREYCSFWFGAEYANELTLLIMKLERTLPRQVYNERGERCDYPTEKPESLPRIQFDNPGAVKSIRNEFLSLDKRMPDSVRENPRYRILYLRALGDYELYINGGIPNEKTDAVFEQLTEIYHAEDAYYFVGPFTRKSIFENKGHI